MSTNRFHHSSESDFTSNVMPLKDTVPMSLDDTMPMALYEQLEREYKQISEDEMPVETGYDTLVQEVEVSEDLLKKYFGHK